MNCRDAYCGDGITDTGEECDEGYRQATIPNVCRDDCTLPYCGDGVLDDETEECDDGNNNNNDGCNNCRLMSNLQQGFMNQPINPAALQNQGSDGRIQRYQNRVINKFQRSEILPLFRFIIGNHKANVYSVDKFIICFETSKKHFESVSLEECQNPTIDVIFSSRVLDELDIVDDDNEVIIQMYEEGEIDVKPRRTLDKVKFGIAGTIGKLVLKLF